MNTLQINEIVHGEVRAVRADKGFCFVTLDGSGISLFVHVNQFDYEDEMVVGQRIWCTVGLDKDHRVCGKVAKVEEQR